jgi:hypothetical protein
MNISNSLKIAEFTIFSKIYKNKFCLKKVSAWFHSYRFEYVFCATTFSAPENTRPPRTRPRLIHIGRVTTDFHTNYLYVQQYNCLWPWWICLQKMFTKILMFHKNSRLPENKPEARLVFLDTGQSAQLVIRGGRFQKRRVTIKYYPKRTPTTWCCSLS